MIISCANGLPRNNTPQARETGNHSLLLVLVTVEELGNSLLVTNGHGVVFISNCQLRHGYLLQLDQHRELAPCLKSTFNFSNSASGNYDNEMQHTHTVFGARISQISFSFLFTIFSGREQFPFTGLYPTGGVRVADISF